jgi:uncharacterized sulfatase
MHYGNWLKENNVDIDRYFGIHEYSDYGKWHLPEEYHNSSWTADTTISVIEEYSKDNRPFFIWSSFQDPHNPCVVPEPWASMYKPEDMPFYGRVEGEMENKPPLYKNILETGQFGDGSDFGDKPWHCVRNSETLGMDEKKSREILAYYYGMISLMDYHIGRIIDELEKKGILDETIIIFTSDHGDYMGNHGLWWKGLPAYDDALRIPMIVSHPQCRTKGEHSSAFQSNIDIAAVILAEAGVDNEALIQGIDQRESWKDSSEVSREWALIEFRPTESEFMQKVFLYEKYKLILYNRDYGELYDMSEDPGQLRNLWDDEESQSIKNMLLMKFISAEMDKDGVLRVRTAPA